MLTQKRKLKDRKQKAQRIYVFLGLILVGFVTASLISFKIFPENGYISPLASKVLSDTDYEEEKAQEMIRKGLQQSEKEVSTIMLKDQAYFVKLANNAEVVLSAKKDLNVQISSLQFILQRLTMEGRQIKKLDMRYDKPVVILE